VSDVLDDIVELVWRENRILPADPGFDFLAKCGSGSLLRISDERQKQISIFTKNWIC
jgi:hypothetical protein